MERDVVQNRLQWAHMLSARFAGKRFAWEEALIALIRIYQR